MISCARDPLAYADFLGALIGAAPAVQQAGRVEWQTSNGRIAVLSPAALKTEFAMEISPPGDQLCHCGLVFAVQDLKQTRAVLGERAADGTPLVLHPAPGADFFFGFVESLD